MTLSATNRRAGPFLGDGEQVEFPFVFKTFRAAELQVVVTDPDSVDTAMVLDLNYSVTLNGNQDTSPGGTITYQPEDPLPTGYMLTVLSNVPYDQPLDIPPGGNFSPIALENELDRIVMQIQQLVELADRAFIGGVTAANLSMPAPVPGWLLGWNDAGTGLENYPQPDGIEQIESFIVACSDETTPLTTGTAKATFRMPCAMTLSEVRASLTTAQESGDTLTVDVAKNGTSILGLDLLTIDNTEKTSVTATVVTSVSDSALADDDEITIDIAQIGDGTATGLKVTLIGVRA
jgi:hypothetical protein